MIEIAPLTPDLLDAAAELLRDASGPPHGSGCVSALQDFDVARHRIEPLLTIPAVAALSEDRLIGFLAAPTARVGRQDQASIPRRCRGPTARGLSAALHPACRGPHPDRRVQPHDRRRRG